MFSIRACSKVSCSQLACWLPQMARIIWANSRSFIICPLRTGASLRCACLKNSAATSLALAFVVCFVDLRYRRPLTTKSARPEFTAGLPIEFHRSGLHCGPHWRNLTAPRNELRNVRRSLSQRGLLPRPHFTKHGPTPRQRHDRKVAALTPSVSLSLKS